MAGPPEGALRRVAVDLGLELDVSELESDSGSDGEGEGGGRMVLEEELSGWSHGKGGERVVRRADVGAAKALFGVSVVGMQGRGLGGMGTGGAIPTPGIGGAVQVEPAVLLTPQRASPGGGEGRGTGAAVVDIDMGGMGSEGAASTPVGVDVGCGCSCGVALAGVRRELAKEVRKVRDELMGAVSLLLAEWGLGTWEEEGKLENTWGQWVKDRERARKTHEVASVVERVKADEEKKVARAREDERKVDEAALRQERERVAWLERECEARRNMEVAALTLREAGDVPDEQRLAICETVVKAKSAVEEFEKATPVAPEVVAVGAWRAVGGVVTRKAEVVVRLNGPVGRERTARFKGAVEKVQMLVKDSRRVSWSVAAVVWTEHAADEVLWRVTGVGKDTSDEDVRKELLANVAAVVGANLIRDSWVEKRMSRDVVIRGIPEAEWVKDGLFMLKGGAGGAV